MFASWFRLAGKKQLQACKERRRRTGRPAVEPLEERQVLSGGLDLTGVEFRTIDGSSNNVANPNQGAAETQQIRFGYGSEFPFTALGVDGFGDEIIVGPQRPNPRSISNALHAQSGSVPSERLLTDWVFQWGQFITHDLDLTRTGAQWDALFGGGVGDFRIPVLDPGDPLGPNPIPFHRSQFDPATGTNAIVPGFPEGTFRPNNREVINSITSYLDASMVYGSDPVRAAALRTFQGGKLKTSANGQLLPLNTAGLPNDDRFGAGAELFLAGDVRANENTGLTVSHTLFVREHNRLADRIARLYPGLNDEQIYQVARRIVGAEIQAITYEEYLPAVFGYDLAPNPHDAVYNPAVNASITNSFAHAIFRFGHSQISETLLLVNNGGQTVGSLSIDDAFFNPDFLKDSAANVARVLKGLATQVGQENDLLLVDGIRNNLFGPPGAGGLDLAALDIQRGRDHGLPNYNLMRLLYGLPMLESFSQVSSDPQTQAKLQELYGNVNNIDLFVGALAEDHLPGASVGPLINAIAGNQFVRLRDGDRFFYTQDTFLQSDAVQRILDLDTVTLANVIRWNTNVTNLQDNVFFDRSVLVYEAPEGGANLTLVTTGNSVTLRDTQSGRVLFNRSLNGVAQVILVGSNTVADVFNVYLAGANGRLENGVVVYGGSSAGDRLNVYGRPARDTFAVADTTFSTSRNDPFFTPVVQTVVGRRVTVNGNVIESSGFETTRLVTLGGNDTITDPADLASVVTVWNPRSDD